MTTNPTAAPETCGNCRFLRPTMGGDRCFRYPRTEMTQRGHWCGEFQPKPAPPRDHLWNVPGQGVRKSCIVCQQYADEAAAECSGAPLDDRALTPTPVAVSESPVGDQQRSNFQTEVAKWMQVCFGSDISADQLERADRFTEEALELAQTMPGFTAERAHALVDYVFGRAVGERQQEVGGVMVTLAALCNTVDIEIEAAAETELARIWKKVEQIRAKQAAKPTGSALPIAQQADPYGPPIPHDGGSNVE